MERSASGRSRLGLLPRMFLALAGVGLVPLAVVTLGLFDANVEGMREQVKRTHAVAVGATAARLEAYLDSRWELVQSLAQNPLLAANPDSDPSIELLASTLRSQKRLAAIVVRSDSGEIAVRLQRPSKAESVGRLLDRFAGEAIAVERAEDALWLGFRAVPEAGGLEFLVIDEVQEGEPLEDLFHVKELGEDGELALVDASGDQLLGELHWQELPDELKEQVLSRKVSGARVFETSGGASVVAALWPLREAPWTVVSAQPGRVAEANAAALKRRARWAVGMALLLSGLVLLATYRAVISPLRGILRAQAALEGIEAPAEGNEIALLKISLDRLAERVRNKEALGRVFLGRYQVLELVGEGGMGSVFRGWDPKLQRLVALKTIRPTLTGSSDSSEKIAGLLREAILAARFNHGNVVSIYDVLDSRDAAFIAMELVEGDSLDTYLKRKAKLPAAEAVPIGQAIARALEAAFQQGIAHRDIKPANVLLGFDHSIKVTDFGIASILSRSEDDERVFGTPGFIAPEVILGEGFVARSDLFSLGVLLYRISSGFMPFTGRDVSSLLMNTIQLRHKPLPDDVPMELSVLIDRLLAKQPEERPENASEVRELLDELAARKAWRWRYEPVEESEDTRPLRGDPSASMSRAPTARPRS